jgi:hypothetical protein
MGEAPRQNFKYSDLQFFSLVPLGERVGVRGYSTGKFPAMSPLTLTLSPQEGERE